MPPAPVLAIAAIAAGLYIGGIGIVHGVKKAAHGIKHVAVKVLHRHPKRIDRDQGGQ